MSCSRWQRLIALEVGGDLDPHRSRSLEKHLEGCTACRRLSEELRSQRERLLRLDREVADGVVLGSVRHAVLADLAGRRRPILQLPAVGRRVAFAGAAAVILIVAAVMLRFGATPSRPIVAERRMPTSVPAPTIAPIPSANTELIVEPPQAMSPPAPVEHGPLRLARSDVSNRGPETGISLLAPTEPMTVKILTDDPDVVIYWIVEPKGDKENA
jgi:hypothetical protein